MSLSPVSSGFGTALRQPAVVLAEIAWRWTFGLAAFAIAIFSLAAYLDALPVSNLELMGLPSHERWFMVSALGHILFDSGSRGLLLALIVATAVSVLWMAAAATGRDATLASLLGRKQQGSFRPQLGLAFLRASTFFASLIGYIAAVMIAASLTAGEEPHPGVFLTIFFLLAFAVTFVRSRVNWFIYLAGIYAARDASDTFGAISAAAGLFRRNPGSFMAAGAVFGAIRAVVWCATAFVTLLALAALAGRAAPSAVLVVLLWIALVYFAIADFIYIVRLAGYVAIEENDRNPPVAAPPEPLAPAPIAALKPSPPVPEAPPALPEGASS